MGEFFCAVCGGKAVTAMLDPQGILVIDGPVCRLQVGTAGLEPPDLLRAVIDSADSARLHEIDPEYAPWYCPQCDRAYCAAHWTTETQFDDDFPGWYDSTWGECPAGHRRKLDD